MDLESLINANLALEKRIATDRALRKYFSAVWAKSESQKPQPPPVSVAPVAPGTTRELTLTFPAEMCELLALAAEATGKTPAQILEESFVGYYLKKSDG
jgi:hypothetical protein